MLNEIYLLLNGKIEILFGIFVMLSLFYIALFLECIHVRRKLKTLKKDYKVLWDANTFLRVSNKQLLRKIDDYQLEEDKKK